MPLRGGITAALRQLPVGLQRHEELDDLAGVQAGRREVFRCPAVVGRHRGYEVLEEVVTGHHEDGQGEQGDVDDLEASSAAHQLQEVCESHSSRAANSSRLGFRAEPQSVATGDLCVRCPD